MANEVVVVGGGIGGLTVAALLAARGVDVCLLERQPNVGGCVANFEKFGYTFEPTIGLYSSWEPSGIHDRIFAELPAEAPEVRPLTPSYVVRLPDGAEIAVGADTRQFERALQVTFPECAAAATEFYKQTASISDALLKALQRVPDLRTAGRIRRLYAFLSEIRIAARLLALESQTVSQQLAGTSARFQRFVELQLQTFTDTSIKQCSYPAACVALNLPRHNLFAIRGGASALAARLMESIKASGGKIRLDSPVLRLSYHSDGRASGVDLLSGENVAATKAIVSNMSVWDTYGKLVGLQRTPQDVKKRLTSLRSSGAYLIYAGLDDAADERLPADHLLIASNSQNELEGIIRTSNFSFAVAPPWDSRGPQGKRAVTIWFPTEVDEWFTYQTDQNEQAIRDQTALEIGWQALHEHVPELGGDIEVIDTVTPMTWYDLTRRKLGMVAGVGQALANYGANSLSHFTNIPNVFMVGDTIFPGAGVAAVSHSALIVANEITGH